MMEGSDSRVSTIIIIIIIIVIITIITYACSLGSGPS